MFTKMRKMLSTKSSKTRSKQDGVNNSSSSGLETNITADEEMEQEVEVIEEIIPQKQEQEVQTPGLMLVKHSSSEKTCWICLDGKKSSDELDAPCACPRKVHHKCLAKWQLQSAGKHEECECRFCHKTLPDWRPFLTPKNLQPSKQAVMVVVINGRTERIMVGDGQGGIEEFNKRIRAAFGLSSSEELDLSFICKPPTGQNDQLRLQGSSAFDAAVHCAKISAAQRQQSKIALPDKQ